jgi:hypothetical protein
MGHILLNPDLPGDPRIIGAGPLGCTVYVEAILASKRSGTPGLTATDELRAICARVGRPHGVPADALLARLVEEHLIARRGMAWLILQRDHLWKVGAYGVGQDERHSARYRRWRKVVLTRDRHTCQKCGKGSRGVRLHVHHRQPFAIYPQLRYSVDNGVTLCVECHGDAHGRRLAR